MENETNGLAEGRRREEEEEGEELVCSTDGGADFSFKARNHPWDMQPTGWFINNSMLRD